MDLKHLFWNLIDLDRDGDSPGPEALSGLGLAPAQDQSRDELPVLLVRYENDGAPVPSQLLKELSLSDRVLPAPRGELAQPRQLVETFTCKKLFQLTGV